VSAVLNNVLPVFLLIGLGQALLRTGLAGKSFFETSDRLVYFIFFPALLFWKIGSAGRELTLPAGLMAAVLGCILLAWLASLAYIALARVPAFQAGTFSQVSFRFNTYVGMAVVLSAFGEEGVARFGVIISLAIPFINLLAVSTLVWFGHDRGALGAKLWAVVRSVAVNPLILACLAGILWARLGPELPPFLDRAFALVSAVSLPLALLSIGSGLALSKLRGRAANTLVACGIKLVLMPAAGWLLLRLFGAGALSTAVAMVFFALPTATSAYILSSQLKSDADLAGAAIVASTLLSFVSLSAALVWFG
jgi:hypothetical protein